MRVRRFADAEVASEEVEVEVEAEVEVDATGASFVTWIEGVGDGIGLVTSGTYGGGGECRPGDADESRGSALGEGGRGPAGGGEGGGEPRDLFCGTRLETREEASDRVARLDRREYTDGSDS